MTTANDPFFNDDVTIKLKKDDLRAIDNQIKRTYDSEGEPLFRNRSDFIRAAILRDLRVRST